MANCSDISRRHRLFLRSSCNHIEHVKWVFSLLQDAVILLKLEKSNFFTGTIDYLCHAKQPRQSEITTHTTDAIKELKQPTNNAEHHSFLRFCNLFRPFVSRSAGIAFPLVEKVEKSQPIHSDDLLVDALEAMHELLDKLMSLPILALTYTEGRYALNADACTVQVTVIKIVQ